MPITDEVREKIDEAADKHGFRVPYDGSNSFYDDTAVKSFQAGGEYGYSLALAELLTKGESNSPWIKASVRTPTKEDDYYVKYTTGEKEILYASGTGHHKRWAALVDEWLDEEKLSRMVAELEAARELIKLQNDTIENQHRLMINAEQRGMDKVRVELEAKDKRIAELEGLVRVAHDTGFVTGFNADKSKPRIQNSWDEFKQQHNL